MTSLESAMDYLNTAYRGDPEVDYSQAVGNIFALFGTSVGVPNRIVWDWAEKSNKKLYRIERVVTETKVYLNES